MTEKDKFQAKIEQAKLLTVISSMAVSVTFVITLIVLLSVIFFRHGASPLFLKNYLRQL